MKILVLTYDLPYPPDSGGKTRAYNLIKFLSLHHEIYLLSFIRNWEQKKYLDNLKASTKEIHLVKRDSVWTVNNLVYSTFSPKPLAVKVYDSFLMRKTIKTLLKEHNFDIILLESFYTSDYIDCFKGQKVILGTENIEYLFYKRYVDNYKIYPIRLPMYLDVFKMKRFEESSWSKASAILAVSDVDARVIRNKSSKPLLIVPNGVDLEYFDSLKKKEHKTFRAVFVGNFSYIQNTDAAFNLGTKIWPEIERKTPDLELWLVGKNPPSSLSKLQKKNIKIFSEVEDIREIYEQVDFSPIPIRAASGTRLKALECFAAKIPVISTSVGVEGIGVKDGVHYLRAENTEDFVNAAVKLFENQDLRKNIANNAYNLVKENFNWKVIVERLDDFISREHA